MIQKYGQRKNFVILVVEDDLLIRMTVVDALRDAGFTVLEAEHAGHAIGYLQTDAENVNAVFMDVFMPGPIDGIALAHEANRRWPWIAILIASGRAMPYRSELPLGSRFLPKPYRLAHVVQNLQELTAGSLSSP